RCPGSVFGDNRALHCQCAGRHIDAAARCTGRIVCHRAILKGDRASVEHLDAAASTAGFYVAIESRVDDRGIVRVVVKAAAAVRVGSSVSGNGASRHEKRAACKEIKAAATSAGVARYRAINEGPSAGRAAAAYAAALAAYIGADTIG